MYSIEYAQEARTYALLGFLISLAFYGVVKLNNIYANGSRSTFLVFLKNGALLYFIGSLMALYSHVTAIFFVLGIQIYFFSLFFLNKKFFKNIVKYWVITNIILLIFGCLVYIFNYQQFQKNLIGLNNIVLVNLFTLLFWYMEYKNCLYRQIICFGEHSFIRVNSLGNMPK